MWAFPDRGVPCPQESAGGSKGEGTTIGRMASSMTHVDQAGPRELDAVIGLLEEAAAWLWSRGIHQWQPGSMRAQRPLLQRWARAGALVVATRDGGLAGGCFLVDEVGSEWTGHRGTALYLHKIVVARPHAGCGVSAKLLEWCADQAQRRGVPRLRLDCWDGNDRLRALYRTLGFRELEAVPSRGYEVRLFEREVA
jgi:GNAT superfamily N-acetyltransferase